MEISELRSLRNSHLASRLLRSLNKFLAHRKLSEPDFDALAQGEKFLGVAQHGRELSQKFALSSDVVEATSAYGTVLRAVGHLVHQNNLSQSNMDDVFMDYINTIKDIFDGRANPKNDKDRIRSLRDLFEIIENSSLEKSLKNLADTVIVNDERTFTLLSRSRGALNVR